MPRHRRPVLPDVPLHIVQRGNNRNCCFMSEWDYCVYLDLLAECASATECYVHAYVLMSNHVHLLISPRAADSASKMMKALGQRYAQYANRRHVRTGSLWEGRFHSSLVQDAQYLLICHRYIEMNPVRASMALHPGQYKWSSFSCNALGIDDHILTPHPIYSALGSVQRERLMAYLQLFEAPIPNQTLDLVRRAVNGNYSLGDTAFSKEMADRLGNSVAPRFPGRPRNPKKQAAVR
ncbi:MAG: transposase [Pseudomonadota bacterium]